MKELVKLGEDHFVVLEKTKIKSGDWIGYSNLAQFVPVQYLEGDLQGTELKVTHSTLPLERVYGGAHNPIGHLGFDKIRPISLSEIRKLVGETPPDLDKKSSKFISSIPAAMTRDEINAMQIGFNYGYEAAIKDEHLIDIKKVFRILEKTGVSLPELEKRIMEETSKTRWNVEFNGETLKLV